MFLTFVRTKSFLKVKIASIVTDSKFTAVKWLLRGALSVDLIRDICMH